MFGSYASCFHQKLCIIVSQKLLFICNFCVTRSGKIARNISRSGQYCPLSHILLMYYPDLSKSPIFLISWSFKEVFSRYLFSCNLRSSSIHRDNVLSWGIPSTFITFIAFINLQTYWSEDINPFHATFLFPYPLRTPENLFFYLTFRGY